MIKLISITVSNKENCLSKKNTEVYYFYISFQFVGKASNGQRVAEIQSTNNSAFVAFYQHDYDSLTIRSSSGTLFLVMTMK